MPIFLSRDLRLHFAFGKHYVYVDDDWHISKIVKSFSIEFVTFLKKAIIKNKMILMTKYKANIKQTSTHFKLRLKNQLII